MARAPRTLRSAFATFVTLVLIYYLYSGYGPSRNNEDPLALDRRRAVENAFEHAWSGYSTHCMGHDTLHPVTNTCEDEFGGWGATAIDALSTAIIMGKGTIVLDILHFIEIIDFATVRGSNKIQVFEVVIRHFGSMISAWDLLNGPFKAMVKDKKLMQSLYKQMVRLGDILACAFDTPSGIPRDWLDPAACIGDDGTSNSVAGVGTLVLEFTRLSDITGDLKYAMLASRAEEFLLAPWPPWGEPFPGLLGSSVGINDGHFLNNEGSWGAMADSFYEYLLKAYMYNDSVFSHYLERWKLAADSTIKYLASHPYGHEDLTFLPSWQGNRTFNSMDALSWFAGGNFILGGMIMDNQTLVDFGLSIANAGGVIYSMTSTGLGGEFVRWTEDCGNHWSQQPCTANSSVQILTGEFKLRPEVLETWYFAFRGTKDPKYREWTWSAFEAIEKYCKTDSGYSAISDVTAINGGQKLDKQESFIFAEVFKYIYLMLENDKPYQVQDSRTGVKNHWVYNTEGHPLRVAGTPM